ncbi:MAG TPA: N-6 DNA methylase, partial [Pyrinomonadaceae bacterium]|nr:N-6 DNA methylase [Pyrinomonadaceae bacterium]
MTIPKTFDESFAHVRDLTERFKANEAVYLSQKYIEQEVRDQFLNPFFEALGWDVYHKEHPNPYEREVKIEKSVMVGDRGKRADYAFFTRPNFFQARFLAEAKKPARNLENQGDCFQAIRYGWNSNTPIAVLTDFEQFLVLDSRSKPSVDKSLHLILEKFHYTQFADEEEFRRLYYLFSREAVADGSLEKFVTGLRKSKKAKKEGATPAVGTVQIEPVGDTFLTDLDWHRENLAKAFKRANENLDGEELTEITQRTLDRLVFIRFLEDKLVEPSDIIDRFGKKSGNAWRDFADEMPRLNGIYNGIIFKPHAILDSPAFEPDEKVFRYTLGWLSHRNSSYDFNSIPIHILGSIYERFLGKTITVTDKRAKVEEKPEVRKAGGVYYTPEYIVNYIVENTIGKLISGKTPDEIAKMRFADIACGSGSFLLGMFDFLIRYHVDWYSGIGRNLSGSEGVSSLVENATPSLPVGFPPLTAAARKKRRAEALKAGLVREADGNLQLTLEHKRDILLNNIYGVDLDAQAVEVAQLSLYLKLLEEETAATVQPKLAGLREQLLPSLGKNIVHGNSLIDYDIMDGLGFDAFEHRKLYPMSFEQTFPKVFADGGFDAIVGNPPYDVLEKDRGEESTPHSVLSRYVRQKPTYSDALGGKLNLFRFFIVRSTMLTRENGYTGLIVPLALI